MSSRGICPCPCARGCRGLVGVFQPFLNQLASHMSWTRIHTNQRRFLGDIKEAREELCNDPLIGCPARSRARGPSSFLKEFRFICLLHSFFTIKTSQNQINFGNDRALDQMGSISYSLKTVPNPRGSNAAMTPFTSM